MNRDGNIDSTLELELVFHENGTLIQVNEVTKLSELTEEQEAFIFDGIKDLDFDKYSWE